MALAAINVKKPREAQIWNCCTGNPVLRILPDSNSFLSRFLPILVLKMGKSNRPEWVGILRFCHLTRANWFLTWQGRAESPKYRFAQGKRSDALGYCQ